MPTCGQIIKGIGLGLVALAALTVVVGFGIRSGEEFAASADVKQTMTGMIDKAKRAKPPAKMNEEDRANATRLVNEFKQKLNNRNFTLGRRSTSFTPGQWVYIVAAIIAAAGALMAIGGETLVNKEENAEMAELLADFDVLTDFFKTVVLEVDVQNAEPDDGNQVHNEQKDAQAAITEARKVLTGEPVHPR